MVAEESFVGETQNWAKRKKMTCVPGKTRHGAPPVEGGSRSTYSGLPMAKAPFHATPHKT